MKKMSLIALIFIGVGCGEPNDPQPTGSCSSEVHCKDNRVCKDGVCVAQNDQNAQNDAESGNECSRAMAHEEQCGGELPPAAYDCFPDLEPASSCVESLRPGVFCCDP